MLFGIGCRDEEREGKPAPRRVFTRERGALGRVRIIVCSNFINSLEKWLLGVAWVFGQRVVLF